MTRRIAVLRPEPGNAATCARLREVGCEPLSLPLFAIVPLAWSPSDPAAFDALVLTSANAVRMAGPALATYRGLPIIVVGDATARAARAAGLEVAAIGGSDAASLLERLRERGHTRALHLAGRDHLLTTGDGIAQIIPVYASEAIAIKEAATLLAGTLCLIHSPRAGARLAQIAGDRTTIAIAVISANALAAAGTGWAATAIAASPDDPALIDTALALIDRDEPWRDKDA